MDFPVKLDTKIICTLETDMNKLFESLKKVTAILNTQDTAMICHYAPFMQYEWTKLNDKFRIYLEMSLISKKIESFEEEEG